MSSLELEGRIRSSLQNLSPRSLLVGLTIINVAALVVCALASPWSESPEAALLILLLSAIPLGILEYLSVRIYRTHNRILEELNVDQGRSDHAVLASRAGVLRDEMRSARGSSISFRDSNQLTDSVLRADPMLEPARKSNLTRMMEVYVLQRYVAGEELRLDELGKYLNERALDRVQPLHRDHELAFLIGLAGTVLGLVVQISLTQSSVFTQTFLTGVIVKGCSTLIGILVSMYARSLRQKLHEEYDDLVATLVQFASFYVAPRFVDINPERAAMSEVLRRSIEDLRTTVGGVKANLSEALSLAVAEANKALGQRLKETFATELAEAIKEQITKPFHADVERLKVAITQASASISEGVRGLNEGTREFKREFVALERSSAKMGDQLTNAGNVLNSLTEKFEDIVSQADQVAQKLKEYEGELALIIERHQDNHSDGNGNWVRGELEKLFEDNRSDRKTYSEMFDRFANELFKKRRNM